MYIKLILFCSILISCKTRSPLNETNSRSLFNEKDLSGWTVYGTEKWFVKNQLLICENGKEENFGYLATNKSYTNFELNLEFKRQTDKSNGGVFLHASLDKTNANGLQVEIGPPGHNTGGIHTYDSGWLIKPDPIKDNVLKVGSWNHLKILLNNDTITVWLNDVKMVNLVNPKVKKQEGLIALQIHKGHVSKLQWRNIQIKEL